MRFVSLLFIVALASFACSNGGEQNATPAVTSGSAVTAPTTAASAPTSATATITPAATPTPEPSFGPNLLTNSSFEAGAPDATGWEPATDLENGQIVEWTSDEAYSGTRSLKILSPGQASNWVKVDFVDRIAIDPNSMYLLTARVKTDMGAVFWSGWRYFETESDSSTGPAGSSGQLSVTETEWTELRAVITPLGGLRFLALDLQLAVLPERIGLDPGEDMVIYLDDVSLREVLDQ